MEGEEGTEAESTLGGTAAAGATGSDDLPPPPSVGLMNVREPILPVLKGTGQIEYKIWKRKLQLILSYSNFPKNKFGPLLLATAVEDEAESALEHLEATDVNGNDGVSRIISELDAIWDKIEHHELFQEFDYLIFELKLDKAWSTQQFIAKVKGCVRKLKKLKCILPTELLTYITMRIVGLNKDRRAQLISATPSKGLDFDEICTAMLQLYPSNLPMEWKRSALAAFHDQDSEFSSDET